MQRLFAFVPCNRPDMESCSEEGEASYQLLWATGRSEMAGGEQGLDIRP